MFGKIAQIGFLIATIAVGILLYLLDSKDRKLKDVVYEYQKKVIDDKLKIAKEKLTHDKENFKINKDRYDRLRTRFASYLEGTGDTDAGRDS